MLFANIKFSRKFPDLQHCNLPSHRQSGRAERAVTYLHTASQEELREPWLTCTPPVSKSWESRDLPAHRQSGRAERAVTYLHTASQEELREPWLTCTPPVRKSWESQQGYHECSSWTLIHGQPEEKKTDNQMNYYVYSKTFLSGHSKEDKIGFQDRFSLNAGQKSCRMLIFTRRGVYPLHHNGFITAAPMFWWLW